MRPVSDMHSRKTPQTLRDAMKLMKWFHKEYDGGFHPDDDPKEIVYGTRADGTFVHVFPTKKDRKHYRRLSGAAYDIFTNSNVDPYGVALIGTSEDTECVWDGLECLNWTHHHKIPVRAKNVKKGDTLVICGELHPVSHVANEGYKLHVIEYDTTDSGGYGWRGRLALRGKSVVTLYSRDNWTPVNR